jgi:hypothetical protein
MSQGKEKRLYKQDPPENNWSSPMGSFENSIGYTLELCPWGNNGAGAFIYTFKFSLFNGHSWGEEK